MRKLPLPKVGVHGVKSIGYEEPLEHGDFSIEYDFPCSQTFRDFEHYQNTGNEPLDATFKEVPFTQTPPIKHIVHHIPVYPKKKDNDYY